MKKTVWYISKYFAPKTKTAPGGRGWFLMKGLSDLGYKTIVICSDSNALIDLNNLDDNFKIQDSEGVTLVWLKTFKYSVAKSIRRILSWFHFEYKLFFFDTTLLPKPDTIVVSSLSLLSVLNGLRLKKKFGCRLIFEVRDIWPLTIIEEGGFSKYNPFVLFLSFLERLGYKKSDAIVGTMPNLKAHVSEICKTTSPVYCIPMGVPDLQPHDTNALPREYVDTYLTGKKMKVVYAGTVGITNALEVFLKTAESLRDNQSIEFIIVGDGPLRSTFINDYDHLPNLTFAPKVSKNQVQSLLSYCDVVYFSVFPSKVWEYGQSLNKVIDYMLSGKPVVASYYGYQSMINEANCGSFVPAGNTIALRDKLIELSEMSCAEREEIGSRGKEWLLSYRSYEKLSREFSLILFPPEYV